MVKTACFQSRRHGLIPGRELISRILCAAAKNINSFNRV